MPEIPWAEIGMPGWHRTDRIEAPDRSVTVDGPCPRCHHETSFRIEVGLPGGVGTKTQTTSGAPGASLPVTVICGCGYVHPDRPAESGESGCGAYWYDQES
ncbi:hypothetical protein [Terrabacter sp. Root181]|uniref:hypothetical protein n=1 Tax=Terrabacter sp. Root181 TaxID=1736484 RepID=UPI000A871F4D|nr:hypothetical protein [Terrabacter sp. Root181]